MKNNFKTSLLTLLSFLLSVGMYAQTVNGTVASDDGPLPGATVQVKEQTEELVQILMVIIPSKQHQVMY